MHEFLFVEHLWPLFIGKISLAIRSAVKLYHFVVKVEIVIAKVFHRLTCGVVFNLLQPVLQLGLTCDIVHLNDTGHFS